MGIYDPINYKEPKSAKPPRFSFTPDMPSAPKPIQPEILEPLKPPKFAEAPLKREFTAKRTIDVKPVSSNQPEVTTPKNAINIRPVSANQPEPVYDNLLKVGKLGLRIAKVAPGIQLIANIPDIADLLTNSIKPTVSSEDEVAAIKRAQDKLLQAGSEPAQELEAVTYPFTGGQAAETKYGVNFRIISRGYSEGFTTVQSAAWGPIRGFVLQNTPNPFNYPTYRLFIDGHGNINEGGPTSEPRLVYVRDFDDQNNFGDFRVELESVFRIDGQPDTSGNPPPTSQPVTSSSGTTIASPQTYQREIGDRQPQPLRQQFQIPMLDFAEPLPKLILIPDLLPVDVKQPDPAIDPQAEPITNPLPLPNPAAVDTAPRLGDVATLYGPLSDPNTIKIVSPFGANLISPLPTGQPLTNTGIDRTPQPAPLPAKTPARTPDPEKTELEKTKEDLEKLITSGAAIAGLTPAIQAIGEKVSQTARQTTPEAIATAAETGTCSAFAPNGCNADIKSNAQKAADSSANNGDKLDKVNAGISGLDALQGADTNARVRNIEDKTGSNEFPMILPEYLLNDFMDKQVVIANQVQYNGWLLKQIDALVGLFPIKIERTNEDGQKEMLTFENVSEAIAEITGLLAQIAFDADTAVNVATRATGEALGAKAAVLQVGSYVKAIIDYLGFQTQDISIDVPISVTPGAVGIDGKLQENELGDFLKPSVQRTIGTKNSDPIDQRLIIQRILQNSEIMRHAVYKPLKPFESGVQNTITGDGIKEDRKKEKQREDKEWEKFVKRWEAHTSGTKIDIDDGDKNKNDGDS
jgi:hypothetical protein